MVKNAFAKKIQWFKESELCEILTLLIGFILCLLGIVIILGNIEAIIICGIIGIIGILAFIGIIDILLVVNSGKRRDWKVENNEQMNFLDELNANKNGEKK